MDPVGGLEIDNAVFQSKEREITALSDKLACGVHIALLADQDATGRDELAAEALDTAPLGIGIAAVLGTTTAFFCCHNLFLLK